MRFTCDESSEPLSGPEQITCLPTGDDCHQLYDDADDDDDDDVDDCDDNDDHLSIGMDDEEEG